MLEVSDEGQRRDKCIGYMAGLTYKMVTVANYLYNDKQLSNTTKGSMVAMEKQCVN